MAASMNRRVWLWGMIGGIVVIGIVIAFTRPKWIHSVEQVVEGDGMHQSDHVWFGVIPLSSVDRDPRISVTPKLLAELGRAVKHPAGVDTKGVDYTIHNVYPRMSCYVRLKAKGDMAAMLADYTSQLRSAKVQTYPKGTGLEAEVTGVSANGVKLRIELWDTTVVRGHAYVPTEGQFSFAWNQG